MAGKDIIGMTQGELTRLHIVRKALDKSITQAEAADIIGRCLRQVRRIVRRVKREGDSGVIHKSRGKPSNRTLPGRIKHRALKLYKEKYNDFGPTLASEKLFEIDKIKIDDETLRLWLIEENIPYKQRKKRPHRQRRQRKDHFGEMLQIDGLEHDWFEGRGPECVFMGYIDDATGNPFGRFSPYEGTLPAMDSFKHYVEEYGIPASIYLDKHSTYKSTKKQSIDDQLNNQEHLSQFARAVTELGVNIIYADSPQAKGRIERLFNTFQDRVIKEMRLKGISSIAEGNRFLKRYLPVYARRFGVKPAKKGNLHRPLPKDIDLNKILCKKTERTLRNDFTVAHDKKLYQIENNIRAKKVILEERTDGSMLIRHKGAILKFKEITTRPEKIDQSKPYLPRQVYIPPADHPWRRFKINPQYPQYEQKEKGSQKEKELLLIGT
ncbi:MAG: ISNCY family transposase [Candidatus Omnitrophica bacterium]|nr:ISNCY family transposase [Candidatus Omnitrophota bacterium]